ncbi:hypothetical protein, partial [Mycobacterium cookii]
NSAFEVVFWNGLFAHRQRELVRDTNPLFLKNPGSSIWLRAQTVDIPQKQHADAPPPPKNISPASVRRLPGTTT